ncbi:MAG: proton-conducting transporter membrane subunit [Candidatus Peregrinibacteria bacterium]|nr:proton-conducting transporter membrane subunit [Candidatus Peregrinibacteria bacterium]
MEITIILASFLAAAVLGLLVKHRSILEATSIAATAIAFIGSIIVAVKVAPPGGYETLSFFSIDSFGAIIMLIIGLIGMAVTVYSVFYLRQEVTKEIIGLGRVRQYFIFLNLFLLAMYLAITASSPIFTWIAIEGTTLSTAFLISFYNKHSAMEAAWKYLIISSVGLLLGFFGTLLYFTSIDSSISNSIVSWQTLAANATQMDPMIAKIAFIFVLIGYGTKVGLAPMHTWLPDAHSKAPAPISALLSGVLLNVAIVTIFRFKIITDMVIGETFSQTLLITFGMLSILIAALIILLQKNYKRLLAYSSVENMGIIAIGFGFGTPGIFAATLHMIYHALIKSTLFLSAGTIFLKYSSTKIAKIQGILTTLPVTGIIFFAGFFAITGAPPFGIFITKISILSAGIKMHPVVSIIAMFLMALLFVGFFKHVTEMLFGEKPEGIKTGEISGWLILPPLALILTALFLSFYIPTFLRTLIDNVVSTY